ncbi:MAG TPA: putative Ig domain-containing protein [Mycobacteriales bacterium]|nr:putative Ig domain-containing protein [Mycobacteriales bacterium]
MTTTRRIMTALTGVGVVAATLVVTQATPAGAAPGNLPALAAQPAASAGAQGFHALAPTRVLDTRSGLAGPLGPHGTVDVQLAGVAGIPATGVTAVVFNLTAVAPTAGGFLTVYPTGTARPTSSNLNFTAGQTLADEVIATLGTNGRATIFNAAGDTHVLADVSGWFATGSYYHPLTPIRLLDTRTGLGAPAPGPLGDSHTLDVQISGHAGIPATATAVAYTLTATEPTTSTFITAYPAGEPRPATSNLNLTRGQTTAVMAITKLGSTGAITLYNAAGSTQLITDITGWFTATGQFTPITPTRILDTRTTQSPLPDRATTRLTVAGAVHGTIPRNVDSVVLSVTAVAPTSSGFLTVRPDLSTSTSTINFTAGHSAANLVIAQVDSVEGGVIFITNGATSGSADVVVDVLGWFVTPLTFTPSALPDAALPAGYSQPLTATGGAAPYTWSVSAGSLPAGLSVTSTGPQSAAITGTPTTAGTSTFTIRVTESRGTFVEESLTLTVQPFAPGAVWAWGVGALGVGSTSGSAAPLRVHDLSDVTAIAGGISGAGYALKSDGTVWAWGANSMGQLGDGTTTGRSTPVQVTGLTGVIAIAGGAGSGYALKADGTVWAWGFNAEGELGDGTRLTRLTPVQVTGLSGVIAIGAGFESAVAVTGDGRVWDWGIGLGTMTPFPVPGLTDAVAVDAGTDVGYALKSDGTVWAWGFNEFGSLGNGTMTVRDFGPAPVKTLTDVVSIAAKNRTGHALKADGTVWSWGFNDVGQVGDGTTANRDVAVQVAGLTGVTAITAGLSNGYAITSDGAVWGWGEDDSRQLGVGTSGTRTAPIRIADMPPVTALAAGSGAAYALGTATP